MLVPIVKPNGVLYLVYGKYYDDGTTCIIYQRMGGKPQTAMFDTTPTMAMNTIKEMILNGEV